MTDPKTMTAEEALKRMQDTAVFAHDRARREYWEALDQLTARLSGLASENAALKEQLRIVHGELQHECEVAEKAEAEVERLTNRDVAIRDSLDAMPFETTGEAIERLKQGREKAEAELDAARPLLDEAMKLDSIYVSGGGRLGKELTEVLPLYRNALAYRERKEKP